ncbi:MAG: prephenate dehydrogenase/arogenate dehydrogenase family protein, partial [Saprospiraceae bacterium]|nr:prephenate dehydrogenase/arogenate dehydrogenase family protein [Saprospiraceae bacterium]
MTVGIIGTGLIGGSIAIGLRESGFADSFLGIDTCEKNTAKAVELGLVDEAVVLDEMLERCQIIVVATPVDALVKLLPSILNNIGEGQTVLDVGSTKLPILQAIAGHPKRHRFVATHPMAGTEYSGPTAAIPKLFDGKCCVFCEAEKSAPDAVELALKLY